MGYCAGRPNTSAAQAEVIHLRSDSTALAHRLDSLAKVAHTDTVVLRHDSIAYVTRLKLVTRTDTLLAHDTVYQHDTIAQQAIAQRDTAIQSCDTLVVGLRQALADCGAQQSVYKAQAAVSESTATAYKQLAPDWLQRKEGAVVGLTAALALVLGLIVGHK
jgi:hypothetical protein